MRNYDIVLCDRGILSALVYGNIRNGCQLDEEEILPHIIIHIR